MAEKVEILKMNKAELNEKIQSSRSRLEEALTKISDNRMSLVILHGEWSTKDLIGHLGFWEQRVLNLFDVLKAGEIPEPYEDMDELNDRAVSEMRLRSLADIRDFEREVYENLLRLIRNASDAELFEPDHFPWTGGHAFEEIISDNTWGHYDEHLPELTAWLKRIA
jgi:hypothetical protein